jgi:Dolichyl-phosphate-mannose-protein mannosyltransferase
MMGPVALTAQSPPGVRRRDLAPAAMAAAGVLALHVILSGRYGFHGDELVTLSAGRHPALGYLDRPPGVPLLARAVGLVFGDRLWPLRVVAGLVHATLVAATAYLASRFGGRRQALALAAIAAALLPVFLAEGSLFRPPALDQLWWGLALVLVVRLADGADPREWLALGLVFGLGLETRWTILVLAAAVAVGFAAVPEGRRRLAGRWPWLGATLALALWLPNLVWQASHGWPALDLYRAVAGDARADAGPLGPLVRQLVAAGPAAVVIGVTGVVWLGRRPRWRVPAAVAVAAVLITVAAGLPAATLGPLYVLALAAGAVAFDGWIGIDADRWRQVMTFLVIVALVAVPATTPLLAPRDYATLLHDVDGAVGEEVGWPQMVELVAGVREVLPGDEIPDLRIVTASAGAAAAIDYYGPARGIPRGTALSGEDAYAGLWPDGEPAGTVLFVGFGRRQLAPYCRVVGPLAIVGNDAAVPNRLLGAHIAFCGRLMVTPERLRAGLTRLG